ncbi:MAG: hypothetical protein GY851_05055 [bacterium]|nr:hypothetical protein [bacterium]
MMHHLATLVWLRFTLFRHSLTKLSSVLSLIVTVMVTVGALIAGIGLALVVLMLSAQSREKPFELLGAIDGMVIVFVFVLVIGLLIELQRSETIDLRRMLYLPVSPRTVFGLNFAVSQISPAPILFLLPSAGLAVGLTISMGPRMLLVFPLAVVFYLMVAVWLYFVRGFLAKLMENKRRRRMILVLLPLCFIVVGQLPNMFMIATGKGRRRPPPDNGAVTQTPEQQVAAQRTTQGERQTRDRAIKDGVILANSVIPLGWFPLGVYALADGQTGTAAGCFAGVTLLGALGFSLGYRSTYRYYRGDVTSSGATTRKEKKRVEQARGPGRRPSRAMAERGVPFADEDTAAFAWTQFQGYLRHPQIRMMMIMPIIMAVIVLALPLAKGFKVESVFIRSMALPLLPLWCILMSSMWLYNIFGPDGDGFRALILLPTPRHKYLLGKNLAFLPILAIQCALLVAAGAVFLRPGVSPVIIAAVQMVQGYLAFCIYGNLVSLYFPFRIRADSMRAANPKGVIILVSMVALPIIGILALPTLLAASVDRALQELWGVPSYLPVGVLVSLAFLALTVMIYRFTLEPMGTLLLRREQRILEVLMRDKE